jgi:polyhydroxybutyrate depolymerase
MRSAAGLVGALGALAACTPLRPFAVPAAGTTAREAIAVDGWHRAYLFHAPLSQPPRALLVVLHGGGSNGRSMERTSGLSVVGDRQGFAVAYPEGIGIMGWAQMWNAGHCCGRAQLLGVSDVRFLRALVTSLSHQLGMAPEQVFVVGYSNGALLAYRAGSELSDLLGGIIVFAGTMRGHGPREAPIFELPAPSHAMSVLAGHGTADNRIPYAGKPDGSDVDVSFAQAGRFWAVANGCRAAPTARFDRRAGARIDSYRGCPPGAAVVQVTLYGWDHEWPGRERTGALPQGHPLRGFDFGDTIGAFVSEQLRARSTRTLPAGETR